MDEKLLNMALAIKEKDTYTHDEYDSLKGRVEEINNSDSRNKTVFHDLVEKFFEWDEKEETMSRRIFKGLVRVILELI